MKLMRKRGTLESIGGEGESSSKKSIVQGEPISRKRGVGVSLTRKEHLAQLIQERVWELKKAKKKVSNRRGGKEKRTLRRIEDISSGQKKKGPCHSHLEETVNLRPRRDEWVDKKKKRLPAVEKKRAGDWAPKKKKKGGEKKRARKRRYISRKKRTRGKSGRAPGGELGQTKKKKSFTQGGAVSDPVRRKNGKRKKIHTRRKKESINKGGGATGSLLRKGEGEQGPGGRRAEGERKYGGPGRR